MSKYLVYGLVDPRTKMIRYVGKSTNGLSRPRAHRRSTGRAAHTYCANWVKSLQAEGLDYEIVTLESVKTGEDTSSSERWWILFGRACGWALTNLTDGGEGCSGAKRSDETKAKISAANKGRKRTPEFREHMRQIARTRSPETLAKIGLASKERWPRIQARVVAARPTEVSPDTGRKISAALTGRKRGPYKRK